MMVCVAELSGPALRRLHAGCDRRRAASVVPGARVTVLSAHRVPVGRRRTNGLASLVSSMRSMYALACAAHARVR
ncbi:hypothetical protein BURPSPAST_AC0299 [Burkholderia pseudomallei Pasteur 52237]|nr:hypothetical protein BURPSPAST_AC0299 [Burkholderia pseudomallei Pasteur 52237]